jgi:hypothetical protein
MRKLEEIGFALVKLRKELGEYDALDARGREIIKEVEKEVEVLRKYLPKDHPLRCDKCQKKARRNACPESHFPPEVNGGDD